MDKRSARRAVLIKTAPIALLIALNACASDTASDTKDTSPSDGVGFEQKDLGGGAASDRALSEPMAENENLEETTGAPPNDLAELLDRVAKSPLPEGTPETDAAKVGSSVEDLEGESIDDAVPTSFDPRLDTVADTLPAEPEPDLADHGLDSVEAKLPAAPSVLPFELSLSVPSTGASGLEPIGGGFSLLAGAVPVRPQVWGVTNNSIKVYPSGVATVSRPVNPHWDRYEAVMASRVRALLQARLAARTGLTPAKRAALVNLINHVDTYGFYGLVGALDLPHRSQWIEMITTQETFRQAEAKYTNEIDRIYSVRMRTTLHTALVLTLLDGPPPVNLMTSFIQLHKTAFKDNGGWFTNFKITLPGALNVMLASLRAGMFKYGWTLMFAGVGDLHTRLAVSFVAKGLVGLKTPLLTSTGTIARTVTATRVGTTLSIPLPEGPLKCVVPAAPMSRSATLLSCTFADGVRRNYVSVWDGTEWLTTRPLNYHHVDRNCVGSGATCVGYQDISIVPSATNATVVGGTYALASHWRTDVYLNDGYASHCWYDEYWGGTLISGAPQAVNATRRVPLTFILNPAASSPSDVKASIVTPTFGNNPRAAGQQICMSIKGRWLKCSTFGGAQSLPYKPVTRCLKMP